MKFNTNYRKSSRGKFMALPLLLIVCSSCSHTIAERFAKVLEQETENTSITIRQPRDTQMTDTATYALGKVTTFKDANGNEQSLVLSTHDDATGEDIRTIELGELTVIAKSKQVPERNGKIAIDFIIRVPSTMINDKWQLQLSPKLYLKEDSMHLEKLFLSGADFLKMQKDGILKYQNFLNSIIPDSLYLDNFFNERGYLNALNELDNEFYKKWRNQKLEENKFIDWKNQMNRRYLIYNMQMYKNRHKTAQKPSWKMILPDHWMERTLDLSNAPSKWLVYSDESEKIVKREITKRDSIELSKRYFDFKARARNEHRKEMKQAMYDKYVRFPLEHCRLDTVIQKGNYFEYFYKQDLMVKDDYRKAFLTLDGTAVGMDETRYRIPTTDTLTYYISSVAQFADFSDHYKMEVISRHAQANMTCYISFTAGKSHFDATLDSNRVEIEKVLRTMHSLTDTGELVMDSINMVASASPEGNSTANLNLSRARSISIRDYIAKYTDDKELMNSFHPRAIGEDWDTLYRLIQEQPDSLEHSTEILKLINEEKNPDGRERKIRAYTNDYEWIRSKLYPRLRSVNLAFHLHRRDMVKDTIHTTVIDERYKKAINLLQNRKYKDALEILSEYNDYNTAVCLMSMGYDQKAISILLQEKESANQQYLLSILYSRLKQDDKAVGCFMRSTRLDASKIYRGQLDPEVNRLINTYKLKCDNGL